MSENKVYGILEKPNFPPLTKELAYKIFVYGGPGVGKSSLVNFICEKKHCDRSYTQTNGIQITNSFSSMASQNSIFDLHFWDIGFYSSEIYPHLLEDCLQNVDLILLVFSLNDRSSFMKVEQFLSINSKTLVAKVPPKIILVGTKMDDVENKVVSSHLIKELLEVHNYPFIRLSCLEDSFTKANEVKKMICNALLERDKSIHQS